MVYLAKLARATFLLISRILHFQSPPQDSLPTGLTPENSELPPSGPNQIEVAQLESEQPDFAQELVFFEPKIGLKTFQNYFQNVFSNIIAHYRNRCRSFYIA